MLRICDWTYDDNHPINLDTGKRANINTIINANKRHEVSYGICPDCKKVVDAEIAERRKANA